MSTSDTYAGNSFISRRKRQESITVFNELPADEVDGKRLYRATVLQGVNVDVNYGVNLNARGIDTSNTLKVTLEMRDILPDYTPAGQWNFEMPDTWTVQDGKDFIVIEALSVEAGKSYTKADIQTGMGKRCFEVNALAPKMSINGTLDILEVLGS